MAGQRRDKKHRVLRRGESVRENGKYQFKYHVDGKPHFVYSWRLEPTDPLPIGKKPCLSLRELEKAIGYDLDNRFDPTGKNMTVRELVNKYVATKRGVKQSTRTGYKTVQNFLEREPFGGKKISSIKTSDAKLFLIKLQEVDGKSYSTIHTIRGVLRPAFQMAVDDDVLIKNPFDFQLINVLVNDSVTREAISKEDMNKFLKFIRDDNVYWKYYDVVYILFHTGLRISEFCGLTLHDIDLENKIINIDHQLLRDSNSKKYIQSTKTNAGTRRLPIKDDVAECFKRLIADRPKVECEKMVDGYAGFLCIDDEGEPLVAMHWEHRFNHMVGRYNSIFKLQIPNITPHVCRHTYCTNQAKAGMSPKTLQYLMGHSEIGVTLNTYTHLGLEDAAEEMKRMEQLEKARKEMYGEEKEKPIKQNMFKVV